MRVLLHLMAFLLATVGMAAAVARAGRPLAAILDFDILAQTAVAGGGAWQAGTSYASGAVVSYASASNTRVYVSLAPNNAGHQPDISPLWWDLLTNIANLPAAFAAQGQTMPQQAWVQQVNGIPYVDGVHYPYTAAGIAAACNSLPVQQIGPVSRHPVGRIMIGPGDVTLTGSGLAIPAGCQPVIHGTRFLFSGTAGQAGITFLNSNPFPIGFSGWGTFKAITAGVDAFRVNGGTGWRLGDAASHFEVLGPFRDIVTIAPSQSGEWSQNGSIAGIYIGSDEKNACMTGDVLRTDTGNFADGGWMNNIRISIRSDCPVPSPAPGRTGGVHLINSNSVQKSSIDRHDIRLVNSVIAMGNYTYPAIYFEKTGTAPSSITLSTDGGEIDTPPGGQAWFGVGSAAAAAELLDVRVHRTGGVSAASGIFSSALIGGATGANLESCGGNNSPYGCEYFNYANQYLVVRAGGVYSSISGSGAGNPGGLTWSSTTGHFDFFNPNVPAAKLRLSYGADPWGPKLGIGNAGANPVNPITLHTDAPSGSLLLGKDGSVGALAPGKGVVIKSADGKTCLRLYVANGDDKVSSAVVAYSEIH